MLGGMADLGTRATLSRCDAIDRGWCGGRVAEAAVSGETHSGSSQRARCAQWPSESRWDVRRVAPTGSGVMGFGHAASFAVNALRSVRRVC